MPRHKSYFPRDNSPLDDAQAGGDVAFVGVDMATDAGLLPPGLCSAAINKTFIGGEGRTRGGIFELVNQNAGDTAAGAALFSNPAGYEAILVATEDGVQIVRDSAPVQTIVTDGGSAIPTDATLVQCFDKVLLFRGEDLPVLEWDGDTANEFESIEQSATGDGTDEIPNASFAVAMANRLFVPKRIGARLDCIAVSDPLDYTRYVPQLQTFRINFGTSDDIVGLVPYGKSSLVVGKGGSVAYLTNVNGDLSSVAAGEATRSVGFVARNAVSEVGGRLWFLGQGGVYELLPTGADEEKFAVGEQPVSWPLRPFFQRVNWRAASIACSATDDERFYIAVPIDGATRNNAVAVYNFVRQHWEGYHTFTPTVDLRFWINATWLGQRRLWVIDRGGRALIYGENLGGDCFAGVESAITSTLTTRGYHRSSERRRFLRCQAHVATWRPSLSVSVNTDGVNEETAVITGLTATRTAFLAGEVASYDLDNSDDNHDAAYREDYSVIGSDGLQPQSGAKVELHAERTLRGTARSRGHYMQISITNSAGSCHVLGAAAEAQEADRGTRSYP